MGNYRPVTDSWILGRPKVKYYGAYPNGFLERARWMVAHSRAPVLHVCSGRVQDYPNWKKLCLNDKRLDMSLDAEPDYLQDARDPLPAFEGSSTGMWSGILIDRPYSEEDADHYKPGRDYLPSATFLLRHSLQHVMLYGRVGILDYVLPRPPKDGARFLAKVSVSMGYDNRERVFSLFERTK